MFFEHTSSSAIALNAHATTYAALTGFAVSVDVEEAEMLVEVRFLATSIGAAADAASKGSNVAFGVSVGGTLTKLYLGSHDSVGAGNAFYEGHGFTYLVALTKGRHVIQLHGRCDNAKTINVGDAAAPTRMSVRTVENEQLTPATVPTSRQLAV